MEEEERRIAKKKFEEAEERRRPKAGQRWRREEEGGGGREEESKDKLEREERRPKVRKISSGENPSLALQPGMALLVVLQKDLFRRKSILGSSAWDGTGCAT
ncbi:uncharacterized protein A4U43_C04F17500 [Asparagus officinalis]|uniref:Uncharacterized protein n=1 Tax=Asparagus officinalis TaxID=4686 RepID=A0A5P1F6Y6_ASPOF|nr:uncharacterized protein A4U43_C04F17500 [Asparagus officinalis]